MDIENERFKLKLLLAAIVLFLISAYFSYGELKYATSGTKVPGEVIRTYRQREYGKSGSWEVLAVEYRFTDAAGTGRKAADVLPLDWPVPASGKVMVEYRGERCRLVGTGRRGWVWFFCISILVMAVMVYRLWREAREATHPRPATSGSRRFRRIDARS